MCSHLFEIKQSLKQKNISCRQHELRRDDMQQGCLDFLSVAQLLSVFFFFKDADGILVLRGIFFSM